MKKIIVLLVVIIAIMMITAQSFIGVAPWRVANNTILATLLTPDRLRWVYDINVGKFILRKMKPITQLLPYPVGNDMTSNPILEAPPARVRYLDSNYTVFNAPDMVNFPYAIDSVQWAEHRYPKYMQNQRG